MSDKSGIEWTDATWNPTTGCTKVSPGCKNCYAKHQAWPRLAAMKTGVYSGRKFEDVQCHPERLDQPLRWKKPRMVFVNSMSDLFHDDVPDEFIYDVFAVMAQCPRHTFQILTKRPARMRAVMATPFTAIDRRACALSDRHNVEDWEGNYPLPNVWLGVSVENQETANERIPLLLDTPAAVRWISAEPLLTPLTFRWAVWRPLSRTRSTEHLDGLRELDWVVVGGESGPNARDMNPDWARSLRDQCHEARVPFFMKQMARKAPIPADLQVRQWPEPAALALQEQLGDE